MPLYPFPDVPNAPGVPDVNRSIDVPPEQDGDLNTLADGDSPEAYQDDANGLWMILDGDGNVAVEPDSVIAFDYRNEQRLVSHPIERGSFADFNKVATPFDARIRMTCNGQGQMTREQFLSLLQSLADGIDLLQIVTPDAVYSDVNLVHYDYRRESRNGVTLLTVDAWFEEVRQTAEVGYSNTQTPSGASTKSGGIVNPAPPDERTTAALAQAGVA